MNTRLIVRDNVTYLTNQGCEDTGHVDALKLAELGLPHGEWDGEFHPLTEAEGLLIAEDVVELFGHFALMGYSVLIGDRKYLAPTIEIDFDHDSPFLFDKDEAHAFNQRLLEPLQTLAERTDGLFFWASEPDIEFENGDGKYVVTMFIPIESYALKHANDFAQWAAHLKRITREVAVSLAA